MSDNNIACNFTAINEDERKLHKQNAEKVFNSIEEWQESSNGYVFRLPTETEVIEMAGAFMARERQCCPFFKFTLEITPNNGSVWLKLTGREGVKQYIKQNVISRLDKSEY